MSDQSPTPLDRNDPAIAPQDSEESTTGSTPAPSDAEVSESHDRPQGQPDTQFEQNQQSGGNTYTPDFEPEEKPNIPRSNPHPVQGQDADIDTDGG